jgi:hypothetical protein
MPVEASMKNSGTKLPNAEHFLQSALVPGACFQNTECGRPRPPQRTDDQRSPIRFRGFVIGTLLRPRTSLSDLGIFHRKLGVLDHQNTVAENQNRSYLIYERRVF